LDASIWRLLGTVLLRLNTLRERVIVEQLYSNQMPASAEPLGVTIVVPCYNEVAGIRHLHERLTCAALSLKHAYSVRFVLVDDGSTDGTWDLMRDLFASWPNCTLLRHSANRGIGATILTGIREASTEIVCSIDADCSYDPCELKKLIPMLSSEVDLVTASPYHPAGAVVGISKRRLLMSKTASLFYRQMLRQKLYTYTSCFRVYRRSSILKLNLRHNDFLGIAELVGKLDLHGAVVVECPATLTARVYGISKMKTALVLFRHLGLLAELLAIRLRQARFHRPGPFIRSFDFNEN
jgi:dolichol-phosphate mannosyltransferase